MKILTASQMQEVDRVTSDECGVPSLILMENAGFNLLQELQRRVEDLAKRRIAIICGKGNNGGDGMVLARQLIQREIFPDIFLLAEAKDVSGDARVNLDILKKAGYPIFEVTSSEDWMGVAQSFDLYEILVDAILGTGITKPLKGLFSEVVATINESKALVLSVDIPSGMFSDSVKTAPQNVWADMTVTFTAPKIAHILNEDLDAIGDLTVAPIGTPPELLNREDLTLNLITPDIARDSLPFRKLSSHKGTCGHVAIISGSRGKPGAAGLSSFAALRTGSGLVTVFSPDVVQPLIAGYHPEIMTEGFDSTDQGTFRRSTAEQVLEQLSNMDAAGIGPGLTTEVETVDFVRDVLEKSPIPLVVDADGLNALAGNTRRLHNESEMPLILTPHPGEFARLVEEPVNEVLENPVTLVSQFAQNHALWVVFKNFRTLIATPNGQVYVSPLGNPGMATAGMGDVLTGVLSSIVGRFRAQGQLEHNQVTSAVCLGVYLHGLAGDLSSQSVGLESLVAGDVIAHLPDAFEMLLTD